MASNYDQSAATVVAMDIKAAIGEAVQPVLQGIAVELQSLEAQRAAVERGEQQNADQAHVLKGVRDLLDSRQLLVEQQEKNGWRGRRARALERAYPAIPVDRHASNFRFAVLLLILVCSFF